MKLSGRGSIEVCLRKILIVDDSPVVLSMLSDDLAGEFNVVTAESGEAAVGILEEPERDSFGVYGKFDLIVTDLNMPGMNGFDLANYVRRKNKVNKFTPVVMLTSEDITKDEARKNGCVACIPKSNMPKVSRMVRVLLSD